MKDIQDLYRENSKTLLRASKNLNKLQVGRCGVLRTANSNKIQAGFSFAEFFLNQILYAKEAQAY